jgi:hypothetical protein
MASSTPQAAAGAGAPAADAPRDGPSKWLVGALVVVGGLGAIASAARPIIRQRVKAKAAERAAAAARATAVAPLGSAASLATMETQRAAAVAPLLARLRELQRGHQARHPLWYGRPTPDMVEEMRQALKARAAAEAEDAAAAAAGAAAGGGPGAAPAGAGGKQPALR